jgi:hypothetical protein
MYLARLLLAIFFFGVLGTAAELLLLGHFEDIQQFIPLVLIAIGVVAVVWFATRPSPASLTVFRTTLVLFAVSGLLGVYFHYSGNVEFEREREESLSGLRLFWEAMTGATPALAPGSMILLAAIGYAALRASEPRS